MLLTGPMASEAGVTSGGPSEDARRCMLESFKDAVITTSGAALNELGVKLWWAASRCKVPPFDDEVIERLRAKFMSSIEFNMENDRVTEGQVFHLHLLSAVLEALGDRVVVCQTTWARAKTRTTTTSRWHHT